MERDVFKNKQFNLNVSLDKERHKQYINNSISAKIGDE